MPLGSVRASLGWMSTFEDCYALVNFIQERWVGMLGCGIQPRWA